MDREGASGDHGTEMRDEIDEGRPRRTWVCHGDRRVDEIDMALGGAPTMRARIAKKQKR